MDLKEVGLVDPAQHWYYRSKFVGLRQALLECRAGRFNRVLDVGAGSGYFSEQMVRDGMCSRRVCVDPHYSDSQLSEQVDALFVREADSETVGTCDVALFIDVLEHVDDDVALLRNYVGSLVPGSLVVVSVPAFQSLWSGHDEFLEHRRRYRLDGLTRVVEAAGLSARSERYLFGSGFVPAWVSRKLATGGEAKSQLQPLNRRLDRAVGAWFSAEHRLLRNRWFGLSAVAVGQVEHRR